MTATQGKKTNNQMFRSTALLELHTSFSSSLIVVCLHQRDDDKVLSLNQTNGSQDYLKKAPFLTFLKILDLQHHKKENDIIFVIIQSCK